MSARKKDSDGNRPDDEPGEANADAELLKRIRESGASLPREEDIELWATRARSVKLDEAFSAKAVEAVLAGLESARVVAARDQVLASGPRTWPELVSAIWAAAGLTEVAAAEKLGSSADEVKELLERPLDAAPSLLCRLVLQLELRLDDALDAIRRFTRPRTTRRTPQPLRRPVLAQSGNRGGRSRDPLRRLEEQLRRDLVARGRHDLLEAPPPSRDE